LCRLRKRHVPAEVSDGQAETGLLHLRQLQEAHGRLYGALYPHRPFDRGRDREFTENHTVRRQAWSPVYEALNRAERGRGKRRNAAKRKELEAAEKRIAELSAIFKRLYEDSVTGRISDERFTELSADYEAEQKELKERAAVLQGELSRTLEATQNAEKFMKVVRKYTSFEELTPTLLREFVEKIVVHETEALDGKRRGKLRRQEIEIYYSFVGKVELPD